MGNRDENLRSRRHIVAGLAAGGVTLGIGTIDIRPALAVPGGGIAAEVISKTFGTALGEVAAKAVLNSNIASIFTETERDMQVSGHRVRNVRGFRSVQRQGLVTLDDNDACFAVASDFRAGCFCVVLPPEAGAILSCLDERIGIPTLYQRAGHPFGNIDVLRYATVVKAERRRGRCGMTSVFYTWSGYVLQIEPRDNCFARVAICNPSTGKRLENPKVPTDASDAARVAEAGDWKIV